LLEESSSGEGGGSGVKGRMDQCRRAVAWGS
jgi:hypothetical protein